MKIYSKISKFFMRNTVLKKNFIGFKSYTDFIYSLGQKKNSVKFIFSVFLTFKIFG